MISPGAGIHRRTGGDTLVEAVATLLVLHGIEQIVLVVNAAAHNVSRYRGVDCDNG